MKLAWTGSRRPASGYSVDEVIVIAHDVIENVHDGDIVAQGGCSFVDEIVLRTAVILRDEHGLDIKIETWPADAEPSWEKTSAPVDLILKSDQVHWQAIPLKYLERDRALVDWADYVRAIPLEPFNYTSLGQIVARRASGTNYTARYADEANKLLTVKSLRPRTLAGLSYCIGNPKQQMVGTWCASKESHEPHPFLKLKRISLA